MYQSVILAVLFRISLSMIKSTLTFETLHFLPWQKHSAAAIAQFVDLGVKVVKRPKQFHSEIDDVPEAFRSLMTGLPLAVNTFERTLDQAEGGHLLQPRKP